MNKIISIIILTLLVGCTREPLVVVEYQEVYIPVNPEIDLQIPKRPVLVDNKYTDYLIDILEYTSVLESILGNINKAYGKKEENLTK